MYPAPFVFKMYPAPFVRPFCLTVVRSRTLLFSSVIALMAFTGYFFRDSLANAFGLIIMGFLLIALSAVAMSLNRKYIQAKPAD